MIRVIGQRFRGFSWQNRGTHPVSFRSNRLLAHRGALGFAALCEPPGSPSVQVRTIRLERELRHNGSPGCSSGCPARCGCDRPPAGCGRCRSTSHREWRAWDRCDDSHPVGQDYSACSLSATGTRRNCSRRHAMASACFVMPSSESMARCNSLSSICPASQAFSQCLLRAA